MDILLGNYVQVSSVSLNKNSLSLDIGGTQTLTATVLPNNADDKTVTWTSSNNSIATVSSNGLVTAIAAGNATITATAGGKSATCAVVVAVPVYNYTFTVTVPAGTPASGVIRVAGDFGNGLPVWNAAGAGMEMTKGTDGKYRLTLNNILEGRRYKYVLNGDWWFCEMAAVLAGDDCAYDIPERTTGTSNIINDVVLNWNNVTTTACP